MQSIGKSMSKRSPIPVYSRKPNTINRQVFECISRYTNIVIRNQKEKWVDVRHKFLPVIFELSLSLLWSPNHHHQDETWFHKSVGMFVCVWVCECVSVCVSVFVMSDQCSNQAKPISSSNASAIDMRWGKRRKQRKQEEKCPTIAYIIHHVIMLSSLHLDERCVHPLYKMHSKSQKSLLNCRINRIDCDIFGS